MPDLPPIGDAASTVFRAAALLVRGRKADSEEWQVATELYGAFTRLNQELQILTERLDARAKAHAPETPAPDPARAKVVTRSRPATGPAGQPGQAGEGGGERRDEGGGMRDEPLKGRPS